MRQYATKDDLDKIAALNEKLAPAKFKAEFFDKQGTKGAVRPWRLYPDSRPRGSVRFFDTYEGLEVYANRILDWQSRVENLSVTLKMFDQNAKAVMYWYGNKCWFDMRLREPGTRLDRAFKFDRISLLEERCHRHIREMQAKLELADDAD